MIVATYRYSAVLFPSVSSLCFRVFLYREIFHRQQIFSITSILRNCQETLGAPYFLHCLSTMAFHKLCICFMRYLSMLCGCTDEILEVVCSFYLPDLPDYISFRKKISFILR